MPDAITISTQKPADAAFDYEALRQLGIAHIEKTASAIWTDYNIHDPGITTLELLCYALTELSYRATYSIPDLLAGESNNAAEVKEHFFSAAQILPNKAVTINDYRKLLIDIEGVKNAWLVKKEQVLFADLVERKLTSIRPQKHRFQQVNVKGRYNVLLEFDTNIEAEQKEAIKTLARETLMANRNLCEDFVAIDEVQKTPFRLCSEIELAAAADPVETAAQIFFNIQLYLTPLVKFYWLKDMLAQGFTTDQVFEGPLLTHGFIKECDLQASGLKTEVYLSDIMQAILQVSNVANILDIVFNMLTQATPLPNKWIIDVPDGTQPFVDIDNSKVLFYKNGMPIRPNSVKVKARYSQLMAAHIAGNDLVRTEDITFNTGAFQDVGKYYSVQNHFPKNYGISFWGLPADATAERKMQARQLQAYLYFFDVQLANYLSQLAHVRNLFSIKNEIRTYYTQWVTNLRGYDKSEAAIADSEPLFDTPFSFADHLQTSAENQEAFYSRRNLFLDHLLSRFSESFFDYINVLDSVFEGGSKQELIDTRLRFLQQYPQYSCNRFLAFNYTLPDQVWNSENVSGLEKRIQRLLGVNNVSRRSLVKFYTRVKQETPSPGTTVFWFELIDNKTGEVMLQGVEKFADREDAFDEVNIAAMLYTDQANYITVEDGAQFTIILQDKTAKPIAGGGRKWNTIEEAKNAIISLIAIFRAPSSEEGMFLIEHPLLLNATATPTENDTSAEAFMPICVDENCDECDDTDPYSFRISIVLPAYASRFVQMDFRRYCERVIRMESPAHVFVKICWVNNNQLQEFEKAYEAWLQVKAGVVEDPDQAILQRFIAILTSLKTVYPPSMLEDCKSDAERKLFLLNQNALGTLKS